MGIAKTLRISFSARAVEAPGASFSPMAGEFHDAGVALDEIASLTGNVEPVVLRVRASGGSKGDRAAVSGDWPCSDHLPPARVPPTDWRFSELASLVRSRIPTPEVLRAAASPGGGR